MEWKQTNPDDLQQNKQINLKFKSNQKQEISLN